MLTRPSYLHDVFVDMLEVFLLEHFRFEPRGRSGGRRGLASTVLRWRPAVCLKTPTVQSEKVLPTFALIYEIRQSSYLPLLLYLFIYLFNIFAGYSIQ